MRTRTLRTLVTLVVLSLPIAAFAQEATSLRFYIVPMEADAKGTLRPKYIRNIGIDHSNISYGLEQVFLTACPAITDAQHVTLAANLDVIAIPQNLDATISGTALTTVQQKMEGLRIPADWVTTSHTYRDVLRATAKVFLLMQRFQGLNARAFFEAGITLDTRINQLTQAQRNALLDAANSLGLDTSGVTGPMTIRQALRLLANQLPTFTMEGEIF